MPKPHVVKYHCAIWDEKWEDKLFSSNGWLDFVNCLTDLHPTSDTYVNKRMLDTSHRMGSAVGRSCLNISKVTVS